MNAIHIIYPAIAMFTLTFVCIMAMGLARYRAIKNRDVKISFYRTYDKGQQTPRLHLIGRHIQNHFEVPPLFYIAIILTYVTDSVTTLAIALAWAYVAARCLHSYIHLGSNNVSHRFFTFGTSVLILAGIWFTLLCSLIQL